jgi:hypothetical protein
MGLARRRQSSVHEVVKRSVGAFRAIVSNKNLHGIHLNTKNLHYLPEYSAASVVPVFIGVK